MDVWCFLENVEKCSCLYTLSKCLTDGFARVLFPKIQDLFILEQRLNRNTKWAKTITNFCQTNKTEKQVFQTLKREHHWGEKSEMLK